FQGDGLALAGGQRLLSVQRSRQRTAPVRALHAPVSGRLSLRLERHLLARWAGSGAPRSGRGARPDRGAAGGAGAAGHRPGIDVGAALQVQRTGLSLSDGSSYYNCVRAADAAGNQSPWVASNGITVDLSRPSAAGAVVKDGVGVDLAFQSSPAQLAGNWSGFV